MRKLLPIIFVFCLTANITLAAPNYDPNFKGVTYDTSYNIALRNRLEQQFDKKYYKGEYIDKDGNLVGVYDYPTGAYAREVSQPYCNLKINTNPMHY